MSYNKKCRWFSMEYVGNPGAVPSCNRDAALEAFDCSTCEENPNNAKRTNADLIRSMNDVELAQFMKGCPPGFIQARDCLSFTNCFPCWLDWLKQEVDNGT